MKRIISALISVFLLSTFALTASAEEFSEGLDWLYAVKEDGTAAITVPAMAVVGSGDVIIPAEIDGYIVTEIGDRCFTEQTGIFTAEIPATVTYVGEYAFEKCYGLSTVSFGYDFNNAGGGTQVIGEGAFMNCYGMQSVYLPAGLKVIDDRVFSDCSALTMVDIPYGTEHIGNETFRNCTALQAVIIPDTVTALGDDIFEGCTSRVEVYYEGTKEQWERIEKDNSDFGNIIFSEVVELPDYEPYGNYNGFNYKITKNDTITINGYEEETAYLTIPAEIEGCPVTRIGENAFENCDFLKEVTIPDSITEIGRFAFYDCEELEKITIGKNVTLIDEYAFAECSSLKRMEIPDGVTVIENSLFYNDYCLEEIVIPKSVAEIHNRAFFSCSDLDTIYYSGSEQNWERIPIESGNSYLDDARIIYNYNPASYKPASNLPAVILCVVAVLVPVIVIIIFMTRKKPCCPHCGAEQENDAKFCGNCGKEL